MRIFIQNECHQINGINGKKERYVTSAILIRMVLRIFIQNECHQINGINGKQERCLKKSFREFIYIPGIYI